MGKEALVVSVIPFADVLSGDELGDFWKMFDEDMKGLLGSDPR